MSKYKVGDKVRVKTFNERPFYWDWDGKMDRLMGKVVTISKIDPTGFIPFGVKTKDSAGFLGLWWLKEQDFVPAVEQANEKIIIYREGSNVVALDKRDRKKAVAKCSPEDTFDFSVGARLAFERLLGGDKKDETPKYYSGKTVCFYNHGAPGFTVGKVYVWKGGKTVDDDGDERYSGYPIRDLSDACGHIYGFIELKE